VLGREPEASGSAHWRAVLEDGVPLVDVVRAFVDSPERRALEQRQPIRPDAAPFHRAAELIERAGRLTVVDVGAQALENELDVAGPLIESGRATVVGFEPLEAEAEARRHEGWMMLPYALGDGTRRKFHETVWNPTSSLYEPDFDVMVDFEGLADVCTVKASHLVDTVRLDDALATVLDGPVDFLKLDVQGAEFDVLQGGIRTVMDVLVVHTEVEFHPIYREQPLFDDVARLMRSFGFDLFDLPRMARYRYLSHDPAGPGERLLWADALFVPSTERLDGLDEARTLRLAWMMNDIYAAVDFVSWMLARFDRRTGTAHAVAYANRVQDSSD